LLKGIEAGRKASICSADDAYQFFRKRVDHRIVHFNAVTLSFDDPFVLQERQVLRDRGLGQTETLPDMLDIALLGAKTRHYLKPDRMPEYL
jgi:hypothetical protein